MSRQEDLAAVIMPTTMVLVVAFIVGIQAAANPDGTLAVVTSYVPGLSPLVMPVRQAAGDVAAWEIALSVAVMLVAIALIVRLGGRVYAGALLRTGGRTRSARRCGPSGSDAGTGRRTTASRPAGRLSRGRSCARLQPGHRLPPEPG